MDNVALARINTFGTTSPQNDFTASPLVTIPASALQVLLGTVQELKDEVTVLREEHDRDREEIAALRLKLTSQEQRQEEDTTRLCVDICQDRRRISALEQRPAPSAPPRGEKTIARIAKIEEVLKSRGPTTLKEMERILKISPKEMNRLLAKLDMRRYELHARPGDAREKVVRLKVQFSGSAENR